MVVAVTMEIEGFSGRCVVRRLTGTEEMSRCFSYDVLIQVTEGDLTGFDFRCRPAYLSFKQKDDNSALWHDVRTVKASVAEYVQITHQSTDEVRYRLKLVPELWFSGLSEQTRIFPNASMAEVIAERLARFSPRMETSTQTLQRERPLICQYRESDLNFVSRLMEDRGLYYYFDHTEANAALVISDDTFDYGPRLPFNPAYEMLPGTWTCLARMAPNKVILQAYDFTRPGMEILASAGEDKDPGFDVYIDDEPVLDQEEAEALAQVRLEQLRNQSIVYAFKSVTPRLSPGFLFENAFATATEDSPDKLFVPVRIEHSYVFEDAASHDESNHYINTVSAISANRLFRPDRSTPIPRVEGTEIAHIHVEADTDKAMVDEDGLYSVNLNYVSDKNSGAKLSKLRMQQPAAGADDGFYFPLKKGVEVVIAFNKGNPDLPYIHGAMSNGQFPSHVKVADERNHHNPHHSVIKARHTLVMKSLGGLHQSAWSNDYSPAKPEYQYKEHNGEPPSHRFPELNPDGSLREEMEPWKEYSGDFHIERRYGHKYRFINGNNFNWDNSSTYNFGNAYVEHHELTDTAENRFDLAPEMEKHAEGWEEKKHGLVEKTWGDNVVYHNGRTLGWGERDGGPLETYEYGSRYSEKQVDLHGARVESGPDWQGMTGFVEKTEGDVFTYHQGDAEHISEGDTKIERTGDITETLQGDTVFKRTGRLEATHDGEVVSEFMEQVTTTTHGDLAETMMADVEKTINGKLTATLNGGRETKEMAATKHEYMAPLTVKQVSIEETTSGMKKEIIQGPHMIEYSTTVVEKGAQMKSQEAEVLTMKGSMANVKINLIMLG